MQDATNSTGFDLVISFEQLGDESSTNYAKVGERLEILGVLGTWVSLTD